MHQAYADKDYYLNVYGGISISEQNADLALKQASRHIDTLTYNRIVAKGLVNLSDYQREIVQEVCCQLAEFEQENADMLNSILQSYSLNGASVSFGSSWHIYIQSGVALPRDLYTTLCQTGLCTANLGV